MERVYECPSNKRKDLNAILEKDPYAEESFVRIGYKIKEGATLEENKDCVYVYIKADDAFIKKADERLKDIAKIVTSEVEKRILEKIHKEEESAEAGFGSMFS